MLLHSYWSILVFIFPHFTNTQARMWDVKVCFTKKYYSSVHIILNNNKHLEINPDTKQMCFNDKFILNNEEKPNTIQADRCGHYYAIVGNHDLQEVYFAECTSSCYNKKHEFQKNTQAITWDVKVCFTQNSHFSVVITLNANTSKYISSSSFSKCFNNGFILKSGQKPKYITVSQQSKYYAIVGNHDLQAVYFAECTSNCYNKKYGFKKYTQSITWDVKVCFTQIRYISVDVSLNNNKYSDISSSRNQKCFNNGFILKSGQKPEYITVNQQNKYYAFVGNHDLQEVYFAECTSSCYKKHEFQKTEHWNIAVERSEIYDNYEDYFEIEPYIRKNIYFRENYKTSNTPFVLPMKMNKRSKIDLLTEGKFWLDAIIKLTNMETSENYSCIYVDTESTKKPYHECSVINDSDWEVEITSQFSFISNIKEINIYVRVTDKGNNFSKNLTFKKLAYLPVFSAYTNIGNINIDEAEIYLENNKKFFDLIKIVMRKRFTREEYGCFNIHKTDDTIPKYSCKLLKSKKWLLTVISPEKQERIFSVKIIQDTSSSFSMNFTWNHISFYGNNYIKYFNLKTYENGAIRNIKLHFFNEAMKINKISMINDHVEYEFKTTERNKLQNYPVVKQITKAKKIDSSRSCLFMKIILGFLAFIMVFLIIIFIVFVFRYKKARNKNVSKGNMQTLQVAAVNNKRSSIQNTNSVCVSEPKLEFCTLQQNSLDLYENIDSISNNTQIENDVSALYAMPQRKGPPEPVDDSDIEQLYTQPIKYICR